MSKALRPYLKAIIFTIFIIIGAYFTIPLGPVPFVLSDFFVLLAGLILWPRFAAISVGLYLLLGMLGLPVFADGAGGIEHFTGPTGGYLIGFLLAAIVVSTIAHIGEQRWQKDLVAVLTGYMVIYGFGVMGLVFFADMELMEAISKGMLTFLVPMSIKSSTAVLVNSILHRQELI